MGVREGDVRGVDEGWGWRGEAAMMWCMWPHDVVGGDGKVVGLIG